MNGFSAKLSPVPQPKTPLDDDFTQAEPKVFDAAGDTYRPRKGAHTLMAKIDEKGSEQITLRRSTIWFAGTGIALAAVVFSYGGSIISWARADESQKMQILQLQNDVTAIKDSLKSMQDAMAKDREERQSEALKKATQDGYKLGVLDNGSGHAKEK